MMCDFTTALFTRACHFRPIEFVCKSGNFLLYFRTETVSQMPHVLKSIQHLSLGNDVTSSDKNIVIVWLKHVFISKFFAQHIQCILRTHI